MKRPSGFEKGSGCYTCQCCGRKTRSTGNGDNEHVKLCAECYEMGGIENSIADGNYDNEDHRERLIDEIRELATIITARGGIPESEYI